jgi:hypothetical protein
MNKKLLTLLVASLFSVLFLVNPTSTKAATITAGPAGVNGLRAYPGPGRGQVTLEWSRVTLTGENYTIHYGTTSGNLQYLADHVGYIATYTVSNLTPGQRYYFTLERIQVGNVSIGWSGEVSVVAATGSVSPVVTSGPIGRNLLTATAIGGGKVRLNWRKFFSGSEGWHVVYGTKPGQFSYGVLNAVTASSTVGDYTFTVGALRPGQRYYFALAPVLNGTAIYITAEVSVVAR